jgi:hypothetical protein
VYGVGCDLLETGHVLCVLSSIDQREEFSSLVPPVPNKHVRAMMSLGGFLLTPVSARQTAVSFIFTLDPQLRYVPSVLLNFALKQGAQLVFQVRAPNCRQSVMLTVLTRAGPRAPGQSRVRGRALRDAHARAAGILSCPAAAL